MTPADLLNKARNDGVNLDLIGGQIRAKFPGETRRIWADLLRQHRAAIADLLKVEALVHRYCALIDERDPVLIDGVILAAHDPACRAWIERRLTELEP